MLKSVFEYQAYKPYLHDLVRSKGRGEKSKIARVLRCHVAYVSQVLKGSAQFSLEQADVLSTYLGHSDDEVEYFNLLVSHARSGSASLSERLERKILHVLKERLVLEN